MTDPSPISADTASATAAASGLDFPVVGIGASAGGLAAVQTLLDGLPAAPDMAFVVVMHLSPTHESHAAAIFQTRTRMNVSQVQGSVKIERDHVYVIPPNHDLQMFDGSLSLRPAAAPRPPRHVVIDLFFRTLADAHGDRAIGILLSGTGSDGSAGIARLKEQGGIVMAQAPNDAEYDDLPRNAIATGKVDIVLPAADMANRLLEIWRNTRRIEMPGGRRIATDASPPHSPDDAEATLRDVMRLLLQRTGHDFRNYKRATVLRRIERRLQVNALPDLPAYRDFLDGEAVEAKALLDDMLIGVTQFFRDRPAFEALEREVMPKLFEAGDGTAGTPVRAWVAGCSTGEEAYSVAMLLADEAERAMPQRPYTVFATDLDDRAIAWGRSGLYPDAVSVDVPPPRLRAYFAAEPGGFRIHKSLRERLIFATHNVLRDPPFSRLDLITCRNLLIYLDRQAQHAVLELFHFALRPGGYLFLGTSETVDAAGRLFSPVDKAMRIYRANPVSRSLRAPPPMPVERVAISTPARPRLPEDGQRQSTPAEVHQKLLETLAPPSVLIDHEHNILHVSGSAARFLRYGAGEPSHSLIDAVDSRVGAELRTLLFQASQLHGRVESAPLPSGSDTRPTLLRIAVEPARHDAWPGALMLVVFDEVELPGERARRDDATVDPAIARLEAELARRSEQLHTVIEQYEASAEELKASNEELQASNEELRSATEEIETSKEELQSTNEELITVNHELKTKIDETSEINDDLKNLISSSDMATVFVDPAMRIKRFTPAAAAVFNLIAADIGRSLFDITHKLDYEGLADDARAVFSSLRTIEREVRSSAGRSFLARLLPYRTAEDRIGGAILNLVDVTSLRRAQADAGIATGADRMALVADAMPTFAILTTDRDGRCTSWNVGAVRLFGWSADEMLGQSLDVVFTPEDRAGGVPREEMRVAREQGLANDDRWLVRKDGSRFFVSGVLAPLRAADGYAKICRDMTEVSGFAESQAGELAEARRGAAENRLKNEFLAVMSHELKHPLNLIGINAQLLATLPEAQGLPAVVRAARVIQRTVQSQGRIIDDLLDMSRLNTGKLALNRAPLLLAEAVQTAMNWAVAEARGKGVRIYSEGFDEPMLIDADAIRIEQIAWNLLSNAIKFSRSGGTVAVRVGHDATEAWLEVTDGGRGIDAESLPHVFDMFRQVDSASTRGEGGLGIGLALVKNLVELHGGRVEATSPGLGHGATFKAVLPLQPTHDVSPLVDRAGPAAVDRLRILLVDDTADTLETFGYLLEHAGHAVRTAGSAVEALGLAAEEDFDLVLSDVGMPGVDGYQMLERLRSGGGRNAEVPAIALTGYGRPQDVKRAFAAGFQAHVDKPVDLAQLAGVIGTVLASSPAKGSGKGGTKG